MESVRDHSRTHLKRGTDRSLVQGGRANGGVVEPGCVIAAGLISKEETMEVWCVMVEGGA